jgi:2-oxoglutarate dehydrogenase E2 component (dihydrolipoamide succinyltransferase)
MDIKVPQLGESITEATVASWLKKEGDAVEADESVVELETDKITMEVGAPVAGVMGSINVKEGKTVGVGEVLGTIDENGAPSQKEEKSEEKEENSKQEKRHKNKNEDNLATPSNEKVLSPAARKIAEEKNIDSSSISGTGKDGRITKEDVMGQSKPEPITPQSQSSRKSSGQEERVRMTRLRQRIAERLKESQQTAALLTTFNEIDMTNVMKLRSDHKETFLKRHGAKLGFMSFFTKAAVSALKEIPAVNAEIDGDEIVYKNYYNIGMAVGTEQGLVVPVIKGADDLSFAAIEKSIVDYADKARSGKLSMEDLSGGTFTITNGGVYGSLMSTPIVNPPQSGILGLHKIEKRPMVVGDQIVIRPMMYVALTYDHRLIDGKEAVTFLVRIKELIENPERLLLEV